MWTGRIVITIMILCASLPALAYDFASGTGEPNDPYQIATAEQLCSIGSNPNLPEKHYILLNDIDLDPNLPGGQVFTQAVIAPTSRKTVVGSGILFTGSLDGRGHEICNLMIRANDAGDVGLFGHIGKQAVVRDLRIANADVAGGTWSCGALAGMNEGSIRQCYAQSRVSAASFAGVLVGYNDEGEITDCWAEGEVTAGQSIGGLVGENWDGAILNSHASSRIVSGYADTTAREIGGLVGRNWGDVVNCRATGDISVLISTQAGGLAGRQHRQ